MRAHYTQSGRPTRVEPPSEISVDRHPASATAVATRQVKDSQLRPEQLSAAIERGIAQRARRQSPRLSGSPLQRSLNDEVPVGDGAWNTARAGTYLTQHDLLNKVKDGLDLKGAREDFLRPLILAKIVEMGNAEAVHDQDAVRAAARTASEYMVQQMEPIKQAHTFEDDEPQVNFWMYTHEESMQKAWGKLMLGRLKHLIAQPPEAGLPEIKELIRRTTSFEQQHENFAILRQMAQMLKDYEAKDQLVDDFEQALGSSFIATPGRDENRHRVEAFVEVSDTVATGPKKNAFAQKLIAESRHLTKGLAHLDRGSLNLEFTLLKLRKHLLKLGFTTDNIAVKRAELGFSEDDDAHLAAVLALDPEAFIAKRFLNHRRDSEDFKRIASTLAVDGIDGIAQPSEISKQKFLELKAAISGEAEQREAQVNTAVEAEAQSIKLNYTNILEKILAAQEHADLDPLLMSDDHRFERSFRTIYAYACGGIYHGGFPVAKATILDIQQHLNEKPDIATPADHIKEHWLDKGALRNRYGELINEIQGLSIDTDRLVAAMPSIAPEELQEVGIALDKPFFASVMGGIVNADVDLSQGYLKALQAAEGDQLVRLAYFLRFVPKSELLAEYKVLLAEHPDEIEALNQKLFAVTKIDLNAGGGLTALSAPISRILLETVSFPDHQEEWETSATDVKAKLAENHHLDDLDGEYQDLLAHVHEKTLGTDVFTLGRTVIFPQGGNAVAIKLLKKGESVGEFHKELAMQKYLAAKKADLGLKSDYPTAVGTYTVDETTFDRLQQRIVTGMEATKQKAVQDEEPKVKDIALEDGAHKRTVMIYKAPKRYFTYQNQAGLTSAHFRGDLPELNEEALTAGREKFFEDAMILLRHGIGFPQLIDLNHNSERIYNWMIDVSRVFETSLQGMGKISNWKTAARYPNMRATGLADLGDMALLDDVQVDYGTEDSTNEQESSSGKIWSLQAQQKQKMFTAQYLGTYVLSSILTEAHGFFVTQKKQLVGGSAISSHAMTLARPTLINRLSHVLKTAFKTFTKTFREVDNADALYGGVIVDADVEQLADQMIFIMSGQYVSKLKDDMLTGDLEDYELAEESGTSFADKLNELNPSKAIEKMRPLKEQQASASNARQALGAHGIYTIPLERGGDDWVKKDDIVQDTETDPSHPFAVDLGFVNGPQPIPKLQDILYKLVTYAMLNVSK